jgi:hypothetical protein
MKPISASPNSLMLVVGKGRAHQAALGESKTAHGLFIVKLCGVGCTN